MISTLLNSVDKKFDGEIYKFKFKYGHDNKKCEKC